MLIIIGYLICPPTDMENPWENLFDLPPLSHVLGSGTEWGCLIMGAKHHGQVPDTSGWKRSRLFAVNLLVAGGGVYKHEAGCSTPLGPGSIYHHFPGTKAGITLSSRTPCSECYLLLDHGTYEGLKKLCIVPDKEVLTLDSPIPALGAFSRLRESCNLPGGRLTVIAELIRFLNGLYQKPLQPQEDRFWGGIVRKAAQELREHLADSLPLRELARRHHVSYPSFRRAFRRIMNVSPGEYRIRQRIDAACALLPDHPVKEVADLLGYCDPFTFSLQFKKFTGMPPSEFRIHG